MKKAVIAVFIALAALAGSVPSRAAAPDAPQTETDVQKMDEKVREIGKELSRVVIENIREFLDEELKRLKKGRAETREEVKKQIPAFEEALKANPRDAQAHNALAKIYDEIDDGANAIIHAREAEKLFVEMKNVKGVAEARRSLRDYYEKYGFKPEDFALPERK